MRYGGSIVLLLVFGALITTSLSSPRAAFATQDLSSYGVIRFNNENWHTLPHPHVANFTVFADGSSRGTTEDGRYFYQYVVPNPYGIRVHRFEIDDHHHYIVDGEIADTFTEFSALLAEAYERTLITG